MTLLTNRIIIIKIFDIAYLQLVKELYVRKVPVSLQDKQFVSRLPLHVKLKNIKIN